MKSIHVHTTWNKLVSVPLDGIKVAYMPPFDPEEEPDRRDDSVEIELSVAEEHYDEMVERLKAGGIESLPPLLSID